MSIGQNIAAIRQTIPENVKLVCVSKFHTEDEIRDAYNVGERVFGESHAQELVRKYDNLPQDIEWHFIGSLQTNKVKYVVPRVTLIHSVDSEHLLAAIDKCAHQNGKVQDILLEMHVAQESTKHGFTARELVDFFREHKEQNYPNVRICGLMAMGTADANAEQLKEEFTQIATALQTTQVYNSNDYFRELSIGMSDDYQLAISMGSTMVRIGTAIFGERK